MKILCLECSAVPCSAAIIEDGKIIASSFINVKLTHSQTLMPMVEDLLKSSMTDISEISGLAISGGPGSFTGVRIGISAVKGIAAPRNLPCVNVSTLLAIAQNFTQFDCTVCAVMDARCNQVYNAIFEIKNGNITRICYDRALLCEELAEEIKKISQSNQNRVIIAGDGADVFFPFLEDLPNVKKAEAQFCYQNAVGVGLTAFENFIKGETLSAQEILPFYLRLPQAERELKLKKELKK